VEELGPDFVVQLVSVYLADLTVRCRQVQDAAEADPVDRAGLSAAAHTLKSSSALVGAEQMEEACRLLEGQVRQDDPGAELRQGALRVHELREATRGALTGWVDLTVQGSNR
jgi:HPt (histidine-containing phosphotransfer) domain-containing protein